MVSAASKLVSGANLPYELGEERTSFAGKTPWRLYAGRSRKLDCDVTVFLYEIKKGTEAQTEMARNALRRYRTLKHPYCVKCLESGARSLLAARTSRSIEAAHCRGPTPQAILARKAGSDEPELARTQHVLCALLAALCPPACGAAGCRRHPQRPRPPSQASLRTWA